jgi:hypothetical protein
MEQNFVKFAFYLFGKNSGFNELQPRSNYS